MYSNTSKAMAKILVIDDNLDICQLLNRFLTKKGHQVETSLTGLEGIEKVKKDSFDLIFVTLSFAKWKVETCSGR